MFFGLTLVGDEMSELTILCVDDEEIILNSLEMQLRDHFGDKFSYELAENASDALEILDELNDPQINILLIISDWLMPGLKGDELLTKVYKKYPSIITVMLTGQADQYAIENAKQHANLHCCIRKPWKKQDLLEAIEAGLEKTPSIA